MHSFREKIKSKNKMMEKKKNKEWKRKKNNSQIANTSYMAT